MTATGWTILDDRGRPMYSILTGKQVVFIDRALAEETVADLNFERRPRAPCRLAPLVARDAAAAGRGPNEAQPDAQPASIPESGE